MHDEGPRDPILSIDEQHGEIAEWAAQVRAAAALDPAAMDPARLAWLQSYFSRGVLGHFDYEERHLFPALLQICGDAQLSDRLEALRAEHVELKGELTALLAGLAQLAETGGAAVQEPLFLEQARRTMTHLEAHAAREDAVIQPLLAEHGARVRTRLVERARVRARGEEELRSATPRWSPPASGGREGGVQASGEIESWWSRMR